MSSPAAVFQKHRRYATLHEDVCGFKAAVSINCLFKSPSTPSGPTRLRCLIHFFVCLHSHIRSPGSANLFAIKLKVYLKLKVYFLPCGRREMENVHFCNPQSMHQFVTGRGDASSVPQPQVHKPQLEGISKTWI